MHDNPQDLHDRSFALPGHRVIELKGADAAAFAQAQFMNDVAALAPGHWHWNGWLTSKGRLIALFLLLRPDAQTLWLIGPDADPQALAVALRRFVFRSKVVIDVRDDLCARVAFAAPASAAGNALGRVDGDGVELDVGTAARPRTLVLSTAAAPDDATLAAQWSLYDLEHGVPRLPPSQAEQWTPQQLSLERLAAFSVRKGCYPGQEIVARTHFLGKAKRGLVLLESTTGIPVGAEVSDGSAAIGQVVASASTPQRNLALAVLPIDRATPANGAGGIDVREAALLDGLQR